MTGLSYDEFGEVFDRFVSSPTARSVFRWEGLQHYSVDDEDPSLRSFREGGPQPERSIRTDPWLARIARSTLDGQSWERVRHITEPLTEYTRWELIAYGESAPVGEQITVVQEVPAAAAGEADFWLFDGDDQADRRAVVMHYDALGRPVEFELREDPVQVDILRGMAAALREAGESLASYLARRRPQVPGDA